MEYTYLGKTGLKVSRLVLGTMNFGPTTEEKDAYRIMDASLDVGINFFDTANMYGFRPDTGVNNRGWTEEILGRWFKQGGSRRERVVLETKVFAPMNNAIDGPNDCDGLSAYKIRRHLDASLKRLGTDHVELYMMHGYDPHCTWEEIWESFDIAKFQGKIDYVGASNVPLTNLIEAQNVAEKRNSIGIVVDQLRFNLISREDAITTIPTVANMGMGLIAYSPMFGGMLSGNLFREMDKGQRTTKYVGKLSEARIAQLKAFSALCAELGEDEAIVAQAWILHNPYITAPIIGPRTVEQLHRSLRALELKLPEDFLKRLDEIFPTGGSMAT